MSIPIPDLSPQPTDSKTLRAMKEAALEILHNIPAEFDFIDLSKRVDLLSPFALKIKPKETEGGLAPFVLNPIQLHHLGSLRKRYRRKTGVDSFRGIRDLILKPRQLGFTTYIAALYFIDGLLHPGRNTLVLTHLAKVSQEVLDKYRTFYDCLPSDIKAGVRLRTASKLHIELEFVDAAGNADPTLKPSSGFMIHTAEGFDLRGLTFSNLHCCLGPDTKLIGRDGYIFPISEPPKEIRDGNGSLIKVTNVSKTNHAGEKALKITTFGNSPFPLVLTKDHKVFTRGSNRGGIWKRADEISKEDYIAFPMTQTSHKKEKTIDIPHEKNCMHIPDKIYADKRLGELFGWYLAEGWVFRNGDEIGGIGLGVHRDETQQIMEVLQYFIENKYFTSVRVSDRRGCLTTHISLYGKTFSKMIVEFLGETESKHIPDKFFKYPKEFLVGLLSGLLEGDGCFTNIRQVSFTSIRPQLSVQLKRLAINLRIGLPSIHVVKAGIRHGRNEKEQWMVRFFGPANVKLRRWLGKPLPPRAKMLQIYIDKHPEKEGHGYGRHKWRRGTTHYWAKVTKIEEIEAPEFMFDVILDKDPHSYTTLGGVVHNSEAAFYDNWPELTRGVLQSIPRKSGNIFLESTANGYNHYKDMVDAALAGGDYWKLTFYSWLKFPEYDVEISRKEAEQIEATLTEDEMRLVLEHNATMGQIKFRRDKLEENGGSVASFKQEYPATISEAFMSTGTLRFNTVVVTRNLELTKKVKPLYDLEEGVQIYAEFDDDDIYVLNADVSEGINKGDGDDLAEIGGTDFSAGSVISARTLRTVATIHGRWEPAHYAAKLARLGTRYDATIVVERNNHGHVVLYALEESCYPKLYRHLEYDIQGQSFLKLGFPTTPATKAVIIDCLAAIIARDSLPACEWRFWAECMVFTRNPAGKCEAMPGRHDDRIMSKAIGVYICTLGAKAWGMTGVVEGADGANLPRARKPVVKESLTTGTNNPWLERVMEQVSSSTGNQTLQVGRETSESPQTLPPATLSPLSSAQESGREIDEKPLPLPGIPQKDEKPTVPAPPADFDTSLYAPRNKGEDILLQLSAQRRDIAQKPTCGSCAFKVLGYGGTLKCGQQNFTVRAEDPACGLWENAQQDEEEETPAYLDFGER